MKFILIRHCETDWNAKEGKLQGHADIELNENGREQAKILAQKLAAFKISNIISSDLKRASETAKIISKNLDVASLALDKRLRECNFGSLEGTLRNDVQKIYKETGCYKSPSDYNFEQFGGESRGSVLKRQLALMNEFKLRPHGLPLIVGHGTSLNTILSEFGYKANLLREEYRLVEF